MACGAGACVMKVEKCSVAEGIIGVNGNENIMRGR
jgi:hypothetical protein